MLAEVSIVKDQVSVSMALVVLQCVIKTRELTWLSL